jgi:HlyD family secretion protein
MKDRTIGIGVFAIVFALIAAGLVGWYLMRTLSAPSSFQGWVEAELVFVSADEAGRVETLSVREGDAVSPGAPLFSLDADLQRAAVAENEAAVINARQTFERAQALLKRAVGSQKAFDDAQSALRTAEARLNSARTRLERRQVASPTDGVVQEVYFRVGEMVQPGRPIVSILPPGNIKVRFFVPQALLPSVRIGDVVSVSCDGCSNPLSARVSFISAQAEFTPPIIYSQEERARLVFRIEAVPEHPQDLRVGQPVSVALRSASRTGTAHARK